MYLARPGTTDQVPRQKYGGMFCNVEGAFESKTLDFDALSVGQRGAKTPRSSQGSGRGAGSRPGVEGDACRGQGRDESREPVPESPKSAGVEIRSATGKEVLQNLGPKDKVSNRGSFLLWPSPPSPASAAMARAQLSCSHFTRRWATRLRKKAIRRGPRFLTCLQLSHFPVCMVRVSGLGHPDAPLTGYF